MTFQEYMAQEEAEGRFCGRKLIEKSAEKFVSKHGGSLEKAVELAEAVYDGNEGFDGEPVSIDFMAQSMLRRRERLGK